MRTGSKLPADQAQIKLLSKKNLLHEIRDRIGSSTSNSDFLGFTADFRHNDEENSSQREAKKVDVLKNSIF